MDAREIKGLEIAAKSKLTRKGAMWLVPSQSGIQEKYAVAMNEEKPPNALAGTMSFVMRTASISLLFSTP